MMTSWKKLLIPCLVPVFTLLYGLGEYLTWWDTISGRKGALAGYEKLLMGNGYPEAFIYEVEPEFRGLTRIVNRNTKNPKLRAVLKDGYKPSYITIDGELAKTTNPKSEIPQFIHIPETAYLVYVFENTPVGNKGTWACSARDVRIWVEESRNMERFWVATILLGLLSIGVAIIEVGKPRAKKHADKHRVQRTPDLEPPAADT